MMSDEKKPIEKKEKKEIEKKRKPKEESEEIVSNGLPEDIDFKKFLGCGG